MMHHTLAIWLLSALVTTVAAPALDWPQLRGASLDGRSQETGLLDADFVLETAWEHPLGEAYSAVSVAGGKALTLFSDGTNDVAIAFGAATGAQLWRTPFAETYLGHDGSTDGPIATPTLDGERVYVISPFGDLVALALTDGRKLWSRHLGEDFGGRAPTYGFSATPLVFGELLVVQAGGDGGRSVVALDRRSGELRWSAGEDRITYQTPVVATLGGERVLLSVGALRVTVLRPEDGEVLRSYAHSEKPPYDPTYPQPLAFGDRLLLLFGDEAVLYQLGADALEELWRSRGFGRSTALPVAHGGYLYGFKGRFLTCLDASDGEVVWKSRPPGGSGLILVDGHLFIHGSNGWLTVIEATPAGYREKTRVRVSTNAGHTAPSFADGRVFVRNLTHVAAVRVVQGARPSTASAGAGEAAEAGEFAAWVRRVEQAPAQARRGLVDEFMSGRALLPVIEDGRVYFVYRGPAEAVSVTGHMLADQLVPDPLTRIPDTDFFYRGYQIETEGRWHYRFQADFDDPVPDPLNPRLAFGEAEEVSELVMPGFRDPDHLRGVADPARAGRLEELEIDSGPLGRTVKVRVYLPASYDTVHEARYPLVILTNGDQWLEAGLKNSLDHLFDRVAQGAVVAFAPIAGWTGGLRGGPATRLIADELLPRLDEVFRLDTSQGSAALWTVQEKAAVALDLVRANPRFGRAALQSARTYRAALEPLSDSTERELHFFVSWSRYESRSAERGYDERRAARELAAWLEGQGYGVDGGELAPGPGFRTWRLQAQEILRFLLPR